MLVSQREFNLSSICNHSVVALAEPEIDAAKMSEQVIDSLYNYFLEAKARLGKSQIELCLKELGYDPKALSMNLLETYKAKTALKWIAIQQEREAHREYAEQFQTIRTKSTVREESDILESDIQKWLLRETKGRAEVKTKFGLIDILTDDTVIEIKRAENWKHALGQVIAYSYEYSDRRRALVLFGNEDIIKHESVADVCAKVDVEVWLVLGATPRSFRLYRVLLSRKINFSRKSGRTKKPSTRNERIEVLAYEAFNSNSFYSDNGHSNNIVSRGSKLLLPEGL